MHIGRGGAATSSSPKKLFDGVRFVLFGFDSVSESQYRSELMNGGGIDVGRYDSSCTHVIVSGRVFDDPVCVLASNDGKILVTELWIDDSLNSGMLADSTKVLYRPVRDLNGIPGSESMHICLTGYQRQERDDIMKMVSLMGARFSKPLIANQVTHLICYKFEGEKYELAKKVNIKLVNHHWLEDCLKTWEILPIDKYTKSGWELEMLEAEAMDSEEENDGGGRRFAEQKSIAEPSNSRGEVPVKIAPGVLMDDNRDMGLLNSTVPTKPPNLSTNNKLFSTPCGDSSSQKANDFCNSNSNLQGRTAEKVRDDHDIVGDIVSKQSSTSDYVNVSRKCNGFPSDVSRSFISTSLREEDKKLSLSCYGSKVPDKIVSPAERSNNSLPYKEKMEETKLNRNSDISSTKSNASAKLCISDDLCTPLSGINTSNVEGRTCSLPQKRKLSVSSVDTKLLKQDQISRTSSLMDTPNICSAQPNSMKPRGLKPDNMPFHNDASGSVCNVVEQSDTFPQKQKQCISSNCKESAGLAQQNSSTCTKQNPSTSMVVPYKETDTGFTHTDNFEATTLGNLGVNQHDTVSKRRSLSYKRKSIKDWHSSSLVKFSGEPTSSSDHKDESSSNGFPPKPALDMKTSETFGEIAGVSNLYSISSSDGKLLSDCPPISESGQVMNTSAERHANCLRSSPASDIADGNEALNSMNLLQQEDSRETEAAVKFESHHGVAMRCKLDLHSETTGHHDRSHDHPEVLPSDLSEKKVKTCAEIPGECKQQKSNEVQSHHKVPVSRRMGCRPKLSKKGNFTSESTSNPHPVIQLSKVATNSRNNIVKEDLTSNKKAEKCQLVNRTSYKAAEGENCLDPEKENKTKDACNLSPLLDKDCGKVIRDCLSLHDAKSSREEAVNSLPRSSSPSGVIFDPVCFILSGPRVQRKEFQLIIRRLGGKVCRDSHQWSYQATHFIVCDPVRRTEKFFAAAASGRWILRSDYLTACSEAGKFLDEESFEWHRNGLTGDGAISLEAPRKWRTLREKTGHGAFYGMHILIYGECIAPPLDTLKRVVKAGDGTILATSPPYTRFLNSGVDFAIVTSGMPRIDIWVQEFLRHEIPCVLADYLVEYVCKPGYSLEKHVLYNTHKWAEKSLANLLTRFKEVILDDSLTSARDSSDDLVCVVCGLLDRGEVMLICGDEGGILGCGIGTHIDCCDPPLEAVPVDDWFCSSCSKTVGQKTTVISTKAKSKKRK